MAWSDCVDRGLWDDAMVWEQTETGVPIVPAVAGGRVVSVAASRGGDRRGRRPLSALLLLAALALALAPIAGVSARAAGPEVVRRVRIPAKDVTKVFPPGTELWVLSPR